VPFFPAIFRRTKNFGPGAVSYHAQFSNKKSFLIGTLTEDKLPELRPLRPAISPLEQTILFLLPFTIMLNCRDRETFSPRLNTLTVSQDCGLCTRYLLAETNIIGL
jgi:hypothetical protein